MSGDILVPIFLFGGAAAVLWKFFEGRHKERILMIEKGLSPSEFNQKSSSVSVTPFWRGNILGNLKWGLLFVFVGIGLIAGQQLHYYLGFEEGVAEFGTIFIAGGVGLILYYFIASRKLKENNTGKK